MGKIVATGTFALAAMLASMASAQSASVDHYSQSQLLDKGKLLEQDATTNGSAGIKLAEYPNHYTMVTLRKKSGGAEIHQNFADIFLVIRGQATLVTGGTVVNPKIAKPGETQGTSVSDGTLTPLHEGDLVHIPAGVPHQLLLPPGGELVYFVVKIREQ
jgi:mannose-6-phosphate isomerase-like protein (cupin superfamily)